MSPAINGDLTRGEKTDEKKKCIYEGKIQIRKTFYECWLAE